MATKKRPVNYIAKFREVLDLIQPVDIKTTPEYEQQRKEEVEKVKQSSHVSDEYMTTRFTASRSRN
jgi:hypothetical protein